MSCIASAIKQRGRHGDEAEAAELLTLIGERSRNAMYLFNVKPTAAPAAAAMNAASGTDVPCSTMRTSNETSTTVAAIHAKPGHDHFPKLHDGLLSTACATGPQNGNAAKQQAIGRQIGGGHW